MYTFTMIMLIHLYLLLCVALGHQYRMVEEGILRIKAWNVRGCLSATPYLRYILEDADILCISEHWLHGNRHHVLEQICDTHHVHVRSSAASAPEKFGVGRGQGGIAIFWRKTIAGISVVTDITHDRCCVIRLQIDGDTTIYFISVYLPCQGGPDDLGTCLDEISEILYSREGRNLCILAGDFNGDIGMRGGGRSRQPPTTQGSLVANFFQNHNMVAGNLMMGVTAPGHTFESHNAMSTLDYIAIPIAIEDRVTECWVSDWHALNTSDHLPINLNIRLVGLKLGRGEPASSDRVRWDKLSGRDMFLKYSSKLRPHFVDILTMLRTSECSPRT